MTMQQRLTTPIIDAEDRPEWFDEKLLSYMPAIYKLANQLAPRDADDLAQESAMTILKSWRSFRQDGGFYNWIVLITRTVAASRRNMTKRRKNINVPGDALYEKLRGEHGSQEDRVHLAQVIDIASGTSAGRVAIRRAMGDGLKEIADDLSVTNLPSALENLRIAVANLDARNA